MPWLVEDGLLTQYSISKTLDPDMAERVRRIRMLRDDNPKEERPAESLKFPVMDEFIPADRQTDEALWPKPKEFNSGMELVGQMGELLELWQFIHAFGSNLEISPMALHILMSALEHEDESNPVIGAICTAFLNQFLRTIRSGRVREERIEQYVGMVQSTLPPFVRPEPAQTVPDEDDLEEYFTGQLLKDPRHWSTELLAFLWDLRAIPEVRSVLSHIRDGDKRIYELSSSIKLRILIILRNFYLTCVTLRPTVDKEIELAANAKHKIRELETERRKVVKETQELLSEQEQLTRQMEEENVEAETLRTLKKTLRGLENRLTKTAKTEERIAGEIISSRNKQFEHSAIRMRPLGDDRHHRRYWWLDLHLVRPALRVHASGLLLVEDEKHWAYYDEAEQVDDLLVFLNPLGCREARLGATLTQYKEQILKTITAFPHGISTPAEEEVLSEEDMPMVVRRRAKRRPEELPEFMRYRNTFKAKKAK
ncbi:hypothetical protein PSACC_03551 [Paramicrosporidium saccamoebae]|uniref:DDT domain-containing protein n=1 Tax=Paramicrosporidium saccamoebae TaxID=1246581 RepID=A0A2H9TFS7_9FUNG|nr:hypothetical protein PSACC_03551 [Paramicrosporidium saccamoebae]